MTPGLPEDLASVSVSVDHRILQVGISLCRRTCWCILARMANRILAMLLLFSAVLRGADGKKLFRERCAGCHGLDARGSGKGPGLAGNPRLSGQSVEQLRGVVERGN